MNDNKRFKIWLDSGANIHSKKESQVTLEEIGMEPEEWDDLDDCQKDEVLRDIAFESLDWGWEEIEE